MTACRASCAPPCIRSKTKLKTFDQPRLAVLMLMMRRHEKDFMLRGDEKYGDELIKRAERVRDRACESRSARRRQGRDHKADR